HDSASIASWTNTEVPSSDTNLRRIAREWKLDETGDVGTITITLDTTLLPDFDTDFNEVVVWIDSDGDFSSGATQYVMDTSNNEFVVQNVAISDGDYVSFGILRPTVYFATTASNGPEGTSPANVKVRINYITANDYSIDYDSVGGTAFKDTVDYYLTNNTLTFTAGDTVEYISIVLNNDTIKESEESILLRLTNPSTNLSLGADSSHTFTINDDDNSRTIQFSITADSANENKVRDSIIIEINNVDNDHHTTVDYTLTGTATGGGTDYTLSSGTFTVFAGFTQNYLSFPITDDALDEDNETIIISLSNPSNASLGTNTQFTYKILDNDTLPDVEFQFSTYNSSEGITPANIPVKISQVSGRDVTVDYSITGGTASGSGTDYTLSGGTVTVNEGDTLAYIQPVIIDDAIIEFEETIILKLSNPDSAELGAKDSVVFIINDNDNAGFTGPAGVGDTSNNKLWIRAEDLSLSNNDPVASWIDTSGNDNDFSQSTGSLQPSYHTSQINGYPTVRFDGSDLLTAPDIISGNIGRTLFIVTKMNTGGGTYDGLILSLDYPNGGAGSGTAFSVTPEVGLRVSGNKVFNEGLGTSNYRILTMSLAAGIDVTATEIYLDGTAGTESSSSSATINTGSNGTALGYSDHVVEYYNGDISEVIIYNTELNDAQRTIIENYLAAKYNLTISNDYYSYQNDHNYDIAGIGKIDASNSHSTAQSAGIIKIENASDLGDNEFLIFGHDNGSVSSWVNTDIPLSDVNFKRLNREWRLSETGDVGTISISLDTSDLPAKPSDFNYYVVWVDADGTFANGATQYYMSLQDGYYKAFNIAISNGNYVAFGLVKPVIQFTDTTANGSEATSPVTVSLSLNYKIADDATIDYSVSGGTATGSGNDYTATAGTATISSGTKTGSFQFTVTNDLLAESEESIEFTLSNPSDGITLGSDSVFTYYINDNDNSRKIQFVSTTLTADEDSTPVYAKIEISSIDGGSHTTAD
ncbi:Calx-beta domain-containing protein, partial [Bacteroidota bacterium]